MDYPRGLTETKPLHVHASYEYSFPKTFTVQLNQRESTVYYLYKSDLNIACIRIGWNWNLGKIRII